MWFESTGRPAPPPAPLDASTCPSGGDTRHCSSMEEQAAVNRWMQVRFLPMPPCYMGEPGIVEPGRAGEGIINDFRILAIWIGVVLEMPTAYFVLADIAIFIKLVSLCLEFYKAGSF